MLYAIVAVDPYAVEGAFPRVIVKPLLETLP